MAQLMLCNPGGPNSLQTVITKFGCTPIKTQHKMTLISLFQNIVMGAPLAMQMRIIEDFQIC